MVVKVARGHPFVATAAADIYHSFSRSLCNNKMAGPNQLGKREPAEKADLGDFFLTFESRLDSLMEEVESDAEIIVRRLIQGEQDGKSREAAGLGRLGNHQPAQTADANSPFAMAARRLEALLAKWERDEKTGEVTGMEELAQIEEHAEAIARRIAARQQGDQRKQ